MIEAILLAMPAATHAGCADLWQVRINAESFASNGAGRTFNAGELASFRKRLEAELRSAMNNACAIGEVPAATAKSVETVEAFSASGATEPRLYARGGDRLAIEWVFAEQGLAIPPGADIVAGTACWIDPEGEACASEGD